MSNTKVTLSQDELNEVIVHNIREWVDEEMQENEGSKVTREDRVAETITNFVQELLDYLPYRNYDKEDK